MIGFSDVGWNIGRLTNLTIKLEELFFFNKEDSTRKGGSASEESERIIRAEWRYRVRTGRAHTAGTYAFDI